MHMRNGEVLAIVPARGGSKGIPRKNLQLLAGKPLLAYTVEHALQTPRITRVVVSTDDDEIATVARQFGAEIVMRPPAISGDTATTEAALTHALDHLRDSEGYAPDLVVLLQPTSPLRRPDDTQLAIEALESEGADSLFSARAVEGFVWRAGPDPIAPVDYDPTARPRRQDLARRTLEENGSIYVFKPSVLTQYDSRLGGTIAMYEMDQLDSFQVDTASDLLLMERLVQVREPAPRAPALAAIRLLVLDFDGVMTDNRVLVDEHGNEAVWCDRADGWGIARLKDDGVEVIVLSTERNPVVSARCRKLDIEAVQGCDDKLAALQDLARDRGLGPEQIGYLGNDVNDSSCMAWVGVPMAVADSTPEILRASRLVTTRRGGDRAVREVADWILAARRA